MSIYKKLNEARLKLQNSGIKKTGKNKYAGFDYYELNDFLPKVNEINEELGLLTVFSIKENVATLKILDEEKEIEFSLPVAEAGMKGMQDIQKLGSQITYMRRYLFMCAYEITEHDAVDALKQDKTSEKFNNSKPKAKKVTLISEGQTKAIYAISKDLGKVDEVKNWLYKKYKVSSTKELTKSQASEIIKLLKEKQEGKDD